MANAIEEALNRASPEARAKAQQVIAEARNNIPTVSIKGVDSVSSQGNPSIKSNDQVMAEARQNIPAGTMKDVKTIEQPLGTPSNKEANPKVIELNAGAQSNIESIQQKGNDNYLHQDQNAVGQALDRQSKAKQSPEPPRQEPQQARGR
jgi:hypothetical protein